MRLHILYIYIYIYNYIYMELGVEKNDAKLLCKYLDNINVYFEYGSGGSTYQASIRKNIKTIYSVESDITWHEKLKEIIKHPNVN